VPIEWSTTEAAVAVGDKHVMMPAAAAVGDSIFNWMHPIDVAGLKGASIDDSAVVELDVPAFVVQGDELAVRAAALAPTNAWVEVENVDSGQRVRKPVALPGDGEASSATFAGLIAGMHRVTVQPSNRMMPPISDYVLVIDRSRV
jgi:hypothetical protein